MALPELTLIVAATRDMGIGAAGGLPWTAGLKQEMAYFARVTKRVIRPPHVTAGSGRNAVIMGRKTWESIPPKFRPLKGRLNIVISRSFTAPPVTPQDPDEEPVEAGSLQAALQYLSQQQHTLQNTEGEGANNGGGDGKGSSGGLGRVFVIGGAQIYAAALQLPQTRRVLLTSVLSDGFECDTFFPLPLTSKTTTTTTTTTTTPEGWMQRSKDELDSWTGETVPEGVQTENGTRYEFQLWEKQD
ncbi:dihydrofolate reductase [Diplogelasinospora grovesii]|uniref:Dihydrofolate reductase n=1 Tax=Diplogelasinospora grovesii TaxID=303347 RepID=A0AAN6S779_9PEZI|nr:dihydrofolate reductase [Diplogelasinospora grovesii]